LNQHVVELTSENWKSEVLESATPVLVDFWAEWCAPCRMIAPAVAALAEEYAGRIKVGKLNVDESGEVAERYGIRSIPTLLVFRAGQVADQRVGALPRSELSALVQRQLATPATTGR
jgi:thioredoxin 1